MDFLEVISIVVPVQKHQNQKWRQEKKPQQFVF